MKSVLVGPVHGNWQTFNRYRYLPSCRWNSALDLGVAAWVFTLSPPFSQATWYGQPGTGTTAFVDTSITFALGGFNTSRVDDVPFFELLRKNSPGMRAAMLGR